MSYIDGSSSGGRKALTGGTVALIQAGIALALVNGLAVHFIKTDPPKPTQGVQISLPPPPPKPVEEPKVQPRIPVAQDTSLDRPKPELPLTPTVSTTPQPPSTWLDDTSGGTISIPSTTPSDPPARFTPQGAAPRNDMARWVTTDDYPTMDIRAGHTGTVKFRVAIGADGRVTGCTVTASSGYPGLDAATCRNVTKRARFDPATDANGERVAGSYSGTIRWVIPQD